LSLAPGEESVLQLDVLGGGQVNQDRIVSATVKVNNESGSRDFNFSLTYRTDWEWSVSPLSHRVEGFSSKVKEVNFAVDFKKGEAIRVSSVECSHSELVATEIVDTSPLRQTVNCKVRLPETIGNNSVVLIIIPTNKETAPLRTLISCNTVAPIKLTPPVLKSSQVNSRWRGSAVLTCLSDDIVVTGATTDVGDVTITKDLSREQYQLSVVALDDIGAKYGTIKVTYTDSKNKNSSNNVNFPLFFHHTSSGKQIEQPPE